MEFHKILVPVIGSESDDEAIKLACELARKSKGKIRAVYVITVTRTLPLEAEIESEVRKAEATLDHVEAVAEEQGYQIETELLQSREAGPTIVDEAVEIAKEFGSRSSSSFVNGVLGSIITASKQK